jgi:hypothetical protein
LNFFSIKLADHALVLVQVSGFQLAAIGLDYWVASVRVGDPIWIIDCRPKRFEQGAGMTA